MTPEQAAALLAMLEAHGEGLCGAAYSAIRALIQEHPMECEKPVYHRPDEDSREQPVPCLTCLPCRINKEGEHG